MAASDKVGGEGGVPQHTSFVNQEGFEKEIRKLASYFYNTPHILAYYLRFDKTHVTAHSDCLQEARRPPGAQHLHSHAVFVYPTLHTKHPNDSKNSHAPPKIKTLLRTDRVAKNTPRATKISKNELTRLLSIHKHTREARTYNRRRQEGEKKYLCAAPPPPKK